MIREMTINDLDTIVAMENELFSSPWPKHEYEYEFNQNPFSHLLVEEENGKILGYCDWWNLFEHAEVANLAVSKAYQRQGIGQRLLDRIVHDANSAGCESLSLEVRVHNEAAIHLYESNGFEQVNVRKNYYDHPVEDAWLMVKPLGGLLNDEDSSN